MLTTRAPGSRRARYQGTPRSLRILLVAGDQDAAGLARRGREPIGHHGVAPPLDLVHPGQDLRRRQAAVRVLELGAQIGDEPRWRALVEPGAAHEAAAQRLRTVLEYGALLRGIQVGGDDLAAIAERCLPTGS